MLGRISNARQRAAQCSALSDAVAPVGASLLVPLLVVFALEVPADAIDRIASPFVGHGRTARLPVRPPDSQGMTGAGWSLVAGAIDRGASVRLQSHGIGLSRSQDGPADAHDGPGTPAGSYRPPGASARRVLVVDELSAEAEADEPGTTAPPARRPAGRGERRTGCRWSTVTAAAGRRGGVGPQPRHPRHPRRDAVSRTEPRARTTESRTPPPATGRPSAGRVRLPLLQLGRSAGPPSSAPAPTARRRTRRARRGRAADWWASRQPRTAPMAASRTARQGPAAPSTRRAPLPARRVSRATTRAPPSPPDTTPADQATPRTLQDTTTTQPGGSGNAYGHDPNGPGNSENAPGHTGQGRGNARRDRGE